MRKFGLIGKSLSHSFSPTYFKKKFEKNGITDAEYVTCELADISEFETLRNENFVGWNVTVPYKEAIIPYLDELDSDAEAIGAVNTIIKRGNKLKGFNTDHIGFERSLLPFLEPTDQKALILGTGGASKAVAYALKRRGINYAFVSRTPEVGQLSYDQLNSSVLPYVQMIVNTTPIGMYPHVDAHPPLPFELIESSHFLVDLIYNPEATLFLQEGIARGARNLNGLSMLHHQADESWRIWNEGN
ncbi:MAG: shikimate dehydrogenase [Flavobacteriia bacterium]|nr:shikimate dehydrogenase [Flavobacteriia bacterium]